MNRRKPIRALPFGINLSDYYFHPTREEKLLDWLHEQKRIWDAEDDVRRRRRAAQIEAEVNAAKEVQAREDRLVRDTNWWLQQREVDRPLMEKLTADLQDALEGNWHKKVLAKLAALEKEIRLDAVRAERKTLLRRGVVRGRRK
jgi:hypothetical protein